MYDVVIVGGGPAGLSAALILGRCRRRVLVCDNGHPRNEASQAMHGYLTRDGIEPCEFLRIARSELTPYDTVEIRDVTVTSATCVEGRFETTLETSEALAPQIPKDRLIVAESGISASADLARLEKLGISAFLVGESLMRQTDVTEATRALLKRKYPDCAPEVG